MSKVQWLLSAAKPIFLGFVLTYLLEPIICFFEKRLSKVSVKKWKIKSCRTWAVAITVCLLFLVMIGIISLLVFSVTDQLRLANFQDLNVLANSYMNIFNDFYKSILNTLEDLNIQSVEVNNFIKNMITQVMDALKGIAVNMVSSVTDISAYIATLFFSLIIGIYFMIDGTLIVGNLKKIAKALLSDKNNQRLSGFLLDADTVFSGYIRGQVTDAAVMMILISLTLSIIGVKFAIIIGVLAGIGNLIPYVGPFVAYFSTTIVCLINGQYKELLFALIVLLIIQTLDGNVIAPRLLSNSIEIHPVLIIIFLVFGNAIGGLLGMLLAVPVGALIKLLFMRFIDQKIQIKENKI